MNETLSTSEIGLVAGNRAWNRTIFEQTVARWPGQWHFVDAPTVLEEAVRKLQPRFTFFLHWSTLVPPHILEATECVCFHMTAVPYGRGGSPLQNLIVRGHRETTLTALRMTEELDAGPIYAQVPLSLEGSAEEIYLRATRQSFDLIEKIWLERPKSVPQSGDVTIFARRAPTQSAIPADLSLLELHDFIRMLDAQDYPRAFFQIGDYRLELSRAALRDGRIVADVEIIIASNEVQS